MAERYDFYVKDNRTIQFNLTEPIMLEDSHVSDWVFHIPRVLNDIDMSGWAWWLVYINARGQKYSELLELSEDPESPLEKCIATYSVDYGMSIRAGVVRFSLEAINADTSGTILNEWHTQTYQAKVQDTLQGNQVEFAETESDIISALIVEVQNKVAQLTGGATPEPKNLVADMTDPKKVYLYVGEESGESTNYWYYHNGTRFVPGGLYASGITVDSVPTQGSTNAVQSGGVYSALDTLQAQIPQIDPTLTQSGQAADSKTVGRELGDVNNNQSLFGIVEASVEPVSTTAIEGYAVCNKEDSASNGQVISSTNAGYCVLEVAAGERYFISTRSGGNYSAVAFFNSSTISKNSYIGSPDYQASYTTLVDHVVTVPTGAVYMTVNTLNYSEYPISIKKLHAIRAVDALYNAGFAYQKDVDAIIANNSKFELCMKRGDSTVQSGKYMDGSTVKNGDISRALTDYFEMQTGDIFLLNFAYKITIFDTSKKYQNEVNVRDIADYSGNVRWNIWKATADGYVRFSLNNTTSPYWSAATKLLNNDEYEIVSLGDSLFGNNQKPYDLTTYIQNATGMKSANCAFGGTRASATTAVQYKPLCFCNLADAIHDNDWAAVDIDWGASYGDYVFMVNKDILVNIDWSKVKVVTVAFGTNDMNGGVDIDNQNDRLDKETFKGGLRYGIEKILSAYPQITIILLAPLYRYRAVGDDYSQIDYDSDNGNGSGGFVMMPYVNAIKEVAEEYHLPFFDNYNGVGLNKFTAPSWLRDGTHLNYTIGHQKVGTVIGEEVASVVNANRPVG